jgi:hypothetical protein
MNRIRAAVRISCSALFVTASLAATGCNSTPSSDQPPLGATRMGREMPVDAASRQFAMDHYRGMVLAENNAQPDTTFVRDPNIAIVQRSDNGDVELSATGEFDVNDAAGHRLRKPYSVFWRRSAGGWTPASTMIMAGRPSPQPFRAVATTGPAFRPLTQPATPANPTAMPPPTGAGVPAPVPGADPAVPGGTTTLPPSGGSGSPSLPPPP